MIQGVTDGENGKPTRYNYNNGNIAADPKLATMNFLNAMDRIPQLIEQHLERGVKLAGDLPILQQSVAGIWKREDDLKELKSEVAALERKIAISLKPVEQGDGSELGQDNTKEQNEERHTNANADSIPIAPINDKVAPRMKR